MFGLSALHEGVWKENLAKLVSVVDECKKSGANVRVLVCSIDHGEQLPWVHAIIKKYLEIFKFLIENGAPINFQDE